MREIYEEFLILEVCSRYYRDVGGDHEAQDWTLYLELTDHIKLCQNAAQACLNFLKTKDLKKLLLEFRLLELYENVILIEKCLSEKEKGSGL